MHLTLNVYRKYCEELKYLSEPLEMQYEHIWERPQTELNTALLQLLAVGAAPGVVWGQLKHTRPREQLWRASSNHRAYITDLTRDKPLNVPPTFLSSTPQQYIVKPQQGRVKYDPTLQKAVITCMCRGRFTSCWQCRIELHVSQNVTCSSLVYSWKHWASVQACGWWCCSLCRYTLSASGIYSSSVCPNRLWEQKTHTVQVSAARWGSQDPWLIGERGNGPGFYCIWHMSYITASQPAVQKKGLSLKGRPHSKPTSSTK